MKFKVSFKDPDVLSDAIREAVKRDLATAVDNGLLAEDEADALADIRMGKVSDICAKWFEYGEYLRVEIDTETKTCTVLPVR